MIETMSLTIEDVRTFLQDRVEKNLLLDAEEFSPEEVDRAKKFTVADFNETPPFTAYDDRDFPFLYLWLMGTCSFLYTSAALRYARNHLPYTSAGLTIDDQNKVSSYQGLASGFKQEYESKKRLIKNSLNLEEGWLAIGSDFG